MVIVVVWFTVNHLRLIAVYTDTVEVLSVTATVAALDRSGWTTSGAVERRLASHIVDTTAGALTTVDIAKTSLSRATPVFSSIIVCVYFRPQSIEQYKLYTMLKSTGVISADHWVGLTTVMAHFCRVFASYDLRPGNGVGLFWYKRKGWTKEENS